MSDSVLPHRWQPTRLPRPWDSPGKNTGVGCHFLLQCMKVKSEREVAWSCPTLSDPMDCSLPGSSIQWIFQARVLEWGAVAFSERLIYLIISQYNVYWLMSITKPFRCYGYRDEQDLQRSYLYEALLENKICTISNIYSLIRCMPLGNFFDLFEYCFLISKL